MSSEDKALEQKVGDHWTRLYSSVVQLYFFLIWSDLLLIQIPVRHFMMWIKPAVRPLVHSLVSEQLYCSLLDIKLYIILKHSNVTHLKQTAYK